MPKASQPPDREHLPQPLRLDRCAEREIAWLWHPRIPLGKVTLLVGDPDSGKSFFALDLAARVSRGLGVPPEPGMEKPGQVLLLSADDDLHDTILPRLRAAEADLHRITLLPAYCTRGNGAQPLSLNREFQWFEDVVKPLKNLRLIIIDPISAYLRGAAAYDHFTIRQFLQRLATIAREKQAAVILVSHQRKQGGSIAIHRPLGSLAFAAVARIVLFLKTDPSVIGRRLLLPAKMTLQSEASARAFTIEEGRVSWEPAIIPVASGDLHEFVFSTEEIDDQRGRAKEWLIEQLEKKRVPADEMKRRARELRIPWRVLRQAKKDAKVRSVHDGAENRWYWQMPDNWIRDFQGIAFPIVI
ncbi:KaiC [Caulifigura coniformis]|uniref:KaiC n=1 Tax=Caulifigura coniformis TaxID=2527983 RepID=A0A517SGR3_9PLAN|nr:AAA family ATPase [Caulifigura coniformis]QDT55277.1 KaiC [Caulifigura coniformis]